MSVPAAVPRRLVSWPLLHAAFVVLVVLAPVAIPLLVVTDLVRGRTRLNLTRVYALAMGVVTVETVGFWAAILMGLTTANGRLVGQRRWLAMNTWLQNRWIAGDMAVARVTCGLRIEIENSEVATRADAVVAGRHLSHADAVFPAVVYALGAGHRVRYLVKEELQWPPAMDLVGSRLPHVWIDRAPGPGSPMLERIRVVGHDVDEHTVACVFPEGTFFTPHRLERAVDRLARTRPDLRRTAARLRHVLPPRPAGTLALLEGAPTADVVVLGHVGLEAFSSIRDIVAAVPLTDPVRIHLWRHPRSEIPTDADGQTTWLVERWAELDEWIESRLEGSGAATSRAPDAA